MTKSVTVKLDTSAVDKVISNHVGFVRKIIDARDAAILALKHISEQGTASAMDTHITEYAKTELDKIISKYGK